MEKEKGLIPIPMMDRDHSDNLPNDQVLQHISVARPLIWTLYSMYVDE